MRHEEFAEFLGRIEGLTAQQTAVLIQCLDSREASGVGGVAQALPAPRRCPHCQAPPIAWEHGERPVGCRATDARVAAGPSMR